MTGGHSLLELLVVLALIGMMVFLGTGNLRSTERQRDFDLFAKEVFSMLETCLWKSLNERVYAGAVLRKPSGAYLLSFYLDGNANGIRQRDILEQKDQSFRTPMQLERASGDLAPGILAESIPEIPPKKGVLDAGDPVRFGKSDIISFSPNGDSSSGTLYLACRSRQQMYAIVLYGPTARMSLWKFSNQKWQMVGDQ